MSPVEAIGYWVAQFAGGIIGALVLWGIVSGSPGYSRSGVGLGADGFGKASIIHLNATSALAAEAVLTFVFVLAVLGATSRLGSPGFGGLATAPEYWETFCDDVLSCFACFEEPQPTTATATARSRAAGSVLPLSDIWGVVRLRHASQRLLKTRCGVVRARGGSGSRRQPGYR